MASVLMVLAGGCSRTLTVDAPRPSRADARACAALLNALPRRVADQTKRRVEAGRGYAAAWGDPAIELRCGVPRPKGLDRFASCQVANGVGWFIPESEQTGHPADITMTTVGRAQVVEVQVPATYFPPVNAMVDLAPALKRTIRELRPCV
ncbi:MAG: hypothetical protein QOF53_1980 [Nocardioidaceae bacterium]|nr:hypothetical protein [Nocardioidaceae bacterium]